MRAGAPRENAGRTRLIQRVRPRLGGGSFLPGREASVAGLQAESDGALVIVVGLTAVYVGPVPDAKCERVATRRHTGGVQRECLVSDAGICDGAAEEQG